MKKLCHNLNNVLYLLKPIWKYGKRYMISCILMSLVINPIKSIAGVFFTQMVVDAIGDGRSFNEILLIIIFFLVILLSVIVIQNAFDTIYREVRWAEISSKINAEVYEKILTTDFECFDDPDFYNSYTWAINEYSSKANQANDLLQNICRSFSTIISMTTFIAIIGPWMILFTVIELLITICFETHRNRLAIKKREEIIPIDRKLGYVQRIFYQREYAADIRSCKLPFFLKRMHCQNSEEKINVTKKYAKGILMWLYAQNVIGVLYNALIMIYISYNMVITKNIVGIGKFTSLITANSQLMTSLYGFLGFIAQADNIGIYGDRIRAFFQRKSKIESFTFDQSTELLQPGPLKVEFCNVSFSYAKSSFKLNNINITVLPGETIGIVGANGVGKSTLIKLLLRLYDVNDGDIKLNNKSIKEYVLTNLRESIGVAFQSPNLYAFSILENLQLHNKSSLSKIEDVLEEMQLNEILIKNRSNIHTQVTREFEPDGIILSGGESQKIALARIISASVGLLILDEPSSALDPLAEYELMNLLEKNSRKTSTIMVAHRLSTVKNADRIYVMDNGCIAECGTHVQLMEQKGIYYNMFQKQSQNYIQ